MSKAKSEGMKTSEFWVTGLIPFVMVILNHVFGWGFTPAELGAGALGSAGYGLSRGLAKGKIK